jgi:uncharacterized membrane protein
MEIIATNLKPRPGSAFSHGWSVVKRYFISLFLIFLIILAAGAPFALFMNIEALAHSHSGLVALTLVITQIFAMAYALFILSPLEYGSKWVYLKAVRGEGFEVVDMFESFKVYLNVILASLLTGAIIMFGFFFLIIPGIVFACRLTFVPFLVMDKRLDPVKAVEESWRLTRGHGWRIFWMGIVSFFLIIAGLIVLIFGVIVSAMWIQAAFASFYQAVLIEKGENIQIPDQQD